MKAKFTEQQPAVFWQPVEKKIFVTICLNETETEEEMGETKQTVYEYDCNQIWIQEGELDEETVRASPEKYLDYIPQKEKTPTDPDADRLPAGDVGDSISVIIRHSIGGQEMMAMLWAQEIINGRKTYEQVPRLLKKEVRRILIDSGLDDPEGETEEETKKEAETE